jgi:hypothetical protein
MDYHIAIPSYNRPQELKEKTLATLHRYKINPKKIIIFVANKKEEKRYLDACDSSMYNKIVVGRKGLTKIHNFITKYYPLNSYIIGLDDDLETFDTLKGERWVPIKSLVKLFEQGYSLMKKYNYHAWGIYLNRNPGFAAKMPAISTNIKFLIGHCCGFINQKIIVHARIKHDYEFSLENSVRDGGVIRFNHISAKTKIGTPGGINSQQESRLETYNSDISFLEKKYGSLVRRNKKRPGEILLARNLPKNLV